MKRKKIKTILCHMAIITICAGVFCHGYINGLSISKYDWVHSYAEADNWTSCDTSDLVTAFRYYCKSRNLAIEGSVADALTSFTTTTFNNICSTLGIDPTQLQAELKKTSVGNLGLRFLFSQTGITAYNRIFAEFLQNNDLEVGEEVDDKVIHSARTITDDNGNSCFVYVLNYDGQSGSYNLNRNVILQYGSKYIYDSNDLLGIVPLNSYQNLSVSINGITYTGNKTGINDSSNGLGFGHSNEYYAGKPLGYTYLSYYDRYYPMYQSNDLSITGSMAIFRLSNGKYAVGSIAFNAPGVFSCSYQLLRDFDDDNSQNSNITVTTNNNTINNNTYNNNWTIIYNEGDTYISDDDDEPSPTTPPGGGGGDNPGGDPDNWNPTTPTIPEPTNPNFPTVNLPDIDIPDLPSLNFSLGDLRNKFPFSLPFDIIAVLNVLDGEPQAPHIEATVPIGKWYTWEMDFDFSEFDNYARIFRAFEFIGFCIGLAVFTVHFVKG